MVVCLAVCDLLMCVSHTIDHANMLAVRDNQPDTLCAVFAFFLHQFMIGQWIVIFF